MVGTKWETKSTWRLHRIKFQHIIIIFFKSKGEYCRDIFSQVKYVSDRIVSLAVVAIINEFIFFYL